jgi:hypothetical protein
MPRPARRDRRTAKRQPCHYRRESPANRGLTGVAGTRSHPKETPATAGFSGRRIVLARRLRSERSQVRILPGALRKCLQWRGFAIKRRRAPEAQPSRPASHPRVQRHKLAAEQTRQRNLVRVSPQAALANPTTHGPRVHPHALCGLYDSDHGCHATPPLRRSRAAKPASLTTSFDGWSPVDRSGRAFAQRPQPASLPPIKLRVRCPLTPPRRSGSRLQPPSQRRLRSPIQDCRFRR